jgi:hypothetical protein
MSELSYWRIRMKDDKQADHSEEGWKRNEVGIWYGAWTADDLAKAEKMDNPLEYLAHVRAQMSLGWSPSNNFLNTARRFAGIPDGHWVILYFGSKLRVAKIRGQLRSEPNHPLNRSSGEVFKFRHIEAKKEFDLEKLPDVYRLIPSAGRGNVHQFNGNYRELVRLLAESPDEQAVQESIRSRPLEEALDLLGDSGWESLCLGYLILEENFVPTGLLLGRTLKDYDIVGRSFESGQRILAQCKKTPYKVEIEPGFIEASQSLGTVGRAFYFAYEGCTGAVPPTINVITRKEIVDWAGTERGKRYVDLFFLGQRALHNLPAPS